MNPTAPAKAIFFSKTFWTQLVAIAAVFYPPVGAWVAGNPVEAVAVFAAVNVLVRFITSGRVTIFPDDNSPPSGKVAAVVATTTLAGLVGLALPACMAGAMPVRIGIAGPDGEVSYSSKAGLEVRTVIRDSGK